MIASWIIYIEWATLLNSSSFLSFTLIFKKDISSGSFRNRINMSKIWSKESSLETGDYWDDPSEDWCCLVLKS